MKRGRYVKTLRNVKLGAGDNLSIVGPDAAGPWHEQGAFAK